jgi:Uma2 family endonuclease
MSSHFPGRPFAAGPPPDENWLWEFYGGQWQPMAPLGPFCSIVTTRLACCLAEHVHTCNLGEVVTHMLFALLPPEGRYRRPEVAFVSFERWPKQRRLSRSEQAWSVVPDLAVEVAGYDEKAEELFERVLEYFRAGVRFVWVVFPRDSLIQVFDSPTNTRIIAGNAVLDGSPLFPGFRLTLDNLFAE